MKMLWGKSYTNCYFYYIKILEKNHKAIVTNNLYVENETWVLMESKIIYLGSLKLTLKKNFWMNSKIDHILGYLS